MVEATSESSLASMEPTGSEPSAGASGAVEASTQGKGEAKASSTEGGSSTEKDVAPSIESTEEKVEETAEEAFKPRTKIKVMDAEHDVPSWLQAAIKDADTEKEAVEILEKAFGLPHVKENLQTTRKERDEVRQAFQKTQADIADVRETYHKGDIDLFLEKLAIPQERMLQWALEKVNYSQLPPEQQRVLDERREAQRRAWSAEKQTSSYEQQMHEQARQAKSMLLESGLTRPDIKTFAESFDARHGKSGAFREEVITAGKLAWAESYGKVDLTPEQAIEQVMKKWRAFLTPGEAQPVAAATSVVTPEGRVVQTASQSKPAVIPNVAGRSTSPMKAKPRSLEDLKKLGREMRAQNA